MTAFTRPPASSAVVAALRHTITWRVLAPTTAVLGIVTIVVAALEFGGREISQTVQLIPFAISILIFGLPHGALDHLIPARLYSGMSIRRSIAAVVVVYLVVGAATAALWILAPVAGFAAFIAMTWFHWGQGDLYIDHLLKQGPTSRVDAAITVTLRGALPMLVPLAAHPHAYGLVFAQTVHAVSPATATSLGHLTDPTDRVIAAGVVALLAVAHIIVRKRAGRPLGRLIVEIGVLAIFFTVVPPILAIGLYFTLWHAVRHILRLELTDPESSSQLRRALLLRPLLRFFRQAWPITLIAVLLLALAAVVLHTANLGVYLVFIAALTTPHAVIVTAMDIRQKTWVSARNPL